MSEALMNSKLIKGITVVSMKIGQQPHLAAIKEAFILIMPLFLLAGLAVMFNYALMPLVFDHIISKFTTADLSGTLATIQSWGNDINSGTLQISALLIAPTIGYILAKNRKFDNPLAAGIVALGSFVMLTPNVMQHIAQDGTTMEITSVLTLDSLGSNGLIVGIIVGLLASETLMFFAKRNLKIYLGDDVPSGVARSFEVLIPILLTMSLLSLASLILKLVTGMDLMGIIVALIQKPLSTVNNSIFGIVALRTLGNFFFSIGIHHTVIAAPFVDPITTANMNANMLAFSQGLEPPFIITSTFVDMFGVMGGTGATISLVIAMIFFTKQSNANQLGRLSIAPALFNINEPIIFGFPIVFNVVMMIPFILVPILNWFIGYFLTYIEIIPRTVVMVPWTTPPILQGFLATNSWRGGAIQLVLIVLNILIYLPFMKINESIEKKMANK